MINCGIIGTGSIANWHVLAIEETGLGKVIGACSKSKPSLNSFCEKYMITPYKTYEDMLADKNINVICICTPSGLHYDHILKAAKARKHIVVEKPMAISSKQCDEIIFILEKYQVTLAIAYQSRFNSSFIKVKKAIDKGALGNIMFADVYMKFHRSSYYYQQSSWKGTWELDGGGALMNQGSHGVDLLLYLAGDVLSVHGRCKTLKHEIETDDTTIASVEFVNGAIGVIQASTSIYPGMPRKIMINGDKGSVIIEEDTVVLFDTENNVIPKGLIIGENDDFSSKDPLDFSIEGHIAIYNNFFDCLKNNKVPILNQYEGRRSIDVITAIYKSAKEHKEIFLKIR
ncbi:MAG: Gfo/Idh/MocA family oxidoreductase [Clostridiales bacterium]|nr:Gfo/Idh/MocA family oxidoreductase [Clostridiales bacterium]